MDGKGWVMRRLGFGCWERGGECGIGMDREFMWDVKWEDS